VWTTSFAIVCLFQPIAEQQPNSTEQSFIYYTSKYAGRLLNLVVSTASCYLLLLPLTFSVLEDYELLLLVVSYAMVLDSQTHT
jgi:hypothetical protein